LNNRLLALALGTFAIGTGSFVFAGLLEGVAEDLSVSVATAGHLVTVFALTYAVSSPVLATLTGNVERKRLLVAAMSLFVAGNLASVISPSFGILLASRIAAAVRAALFTPTAAAVASSIAPPEARGRALSVVTGGLTVAFVVGIPLGSLIGTYSSWRMTFVMVGVLGIVAALGVRFLLPPVETPPVVSLRERMDTMRQPAVVAALLFTFIALMGGFVVFTYTSPLLARITGFGGAGVSGMLLLFGSAAMVGNSLGGYGADHAGYGRLMAAIVVALTVTLLAFSLLVRISGSGAALGSPDSLGGHPGAGAGSRGGGLRRLALQPALEGTRLAARQGA
jgi:MFS transporter, DHA1 family, inner membrane transport protein